MAKQKKPRSTRKQRKAQLNNNREKIVLSHITQIHANIEKDLRALARESLCEDGCPTIKNKQKRWFHTLGATELVMKIDYITYTPYVFD